MRPTAISSPCQNFSLLCLSLNWSIEVTAPSTAASFGTSMSLNWSFLDQTVQVGPGRDIDLRHDDRNHRHSADLRLLHAAGIPVHHCGRRRGQDQSQGDDEALTLRHSSPVLYRSGLSAAGRSSFSPLPSLRLVSCAVARTPQFVHRVAEVLHNTPCWRAGEGA
jgi:hypothetical protein